MSDFLPDPQAVLANLQAILGESAEKLVPWFYDNMPEYYFLTHDEDEQIKHLHAILSGQVRNERQAVQLQSPCGTRVTHITPGVEMSVLAEVLEQHRGKHIQAARIYSSKDDSLRLDTLLLGEQAQCSVDSTSYRDALDFIRTKALVLPENTEQFNEFLSHTTSDYVDKFDGARAVRHFLACECVKGTEQVKVQLEKGVYEGFDRISIAMANPPSKALLLMIVKIFAREGIQLDRGYGDGFTLTSGEKVAIFSFYIAQKDIDLQEDSEVWKRLEKQLRLSKWFAFHGLEALAEEDGWDIGQVMLMQAGAEFAHQFLVSHDLHAYGSSRITHAVLKHRDVTKQLFNYFDAKFNPEFVGDRIAAVEAERNKCREMIHDIPNRYERQIMSYIYRFFRYALRTNYYLPNRLGLSFRMDPLILAPMPKEERPFGFYCFHGPYCFGFQVRYRDMSRGGVRVVRTWSQEHFELESNRLFDEVTKLASAQQFKNKDIPEGGSKAVLLLGPEGEIDLAVKSMVDSLLDIIITPEDPEKNGYTLPGVVDYLGREEIIYLGPDENITPKHIQWFVDRAAKRGYKWPAAFMSSKPRAGIAHKDYGVTSEGVIVFADELLRSMGINPETDPFTVKITGGPAGDVASNVMKILMREYGENARIVAMSDGHGAAFDPDGLDHEELLRLIDAGDRAHAFDQRKLKGEGAFAVSTDTHEGRRIRDELHNTVVADIFIPSGGRPDTINMQNWTSFLQKDGTPSAKAIVEGANIFISANARAELEKKGVLAIPGPSANKTGVICSSYEILAGLILSEQEFLDIKPNYVPQVLDILRKRARDEARMLLREYKLAAGTQTITQLSFKLSREINELGDQIVEMLKEELPTVAQDPVMSELMHSYCPAILVEKYGDRIVNDIPRAHQLSLLGAYIASTMVYQEGLGWARRMVEIGGIKDVIYTYLGEERQIRDMANSIRSCGMKNADLIADIVENAGRKRLTLAHLGMA